MAAWRNLSPTCNGVYRSFWCISDWYIDHNRIFGTAFIPGLIAVIVFALIILWRIRKSDKEFASEYSLHSVKS